MTICTHAPIAPEFVEMLATNATKAVFDWLEANAPRAIYEMAVDADALRFYVRDAGTGPVDEQTAHDTAHTVIGIVNQLAAMGVGFVDDYGMAHERAAAGELATA